MGASVNQLTGSMRTDAKEQTDVKNNQFALILSKK
jgi:hypothetical protein